MCVCVALDFLVFESMCDNVNSDIVDLSFHELTKIPTCLLKHLSGNVTSINLAGNRLTTIPEGVKEWKNLQTIYFSGNQLTTLPEGVKEWKNLQTINFCGNHLTMLPEGVNEWKNLK